MAKSLLRFSCTKHVKYISTVGIDNKLITKCFDFPVGNAWRMGFRIYEEKMYGIEIRNSVSVILYTSWNIRSKLMGIDYRRLDAVFCFFLAEWEEDFANCRHSHRHMQLHNIIFISLHNFDDTTIMNAWFCRIFSHFH